MKIFKKQRKRKKKTLWEQACTEILRRTQKKRSKFFQKMEIIQNYNELCHFPFLTQPKSRPGPFTSTEVAFPLIIHFLDNAGTASLPAPLPSIPFLAPSSFTQLLVDAECRKLRAVLSSHFCCFSRLDQPSPNPRATRAEPGVRSDFSTKWGCGWGSDTKRNSHCSPISFS